MTDLAFTHPLIHRIVHSALPDHVSMLRLDLLEEWASGNKYFKLKESIAQAIENGCRHIISKGGPFSNHLAALAKTCHHFGLKLTCMVRSHIPLAGSPTIMYIQSKGAHIDWLAPARYTAFDHDAAIQMDANAWFVEEGGFDAYGVRGASEIMTLIPAGVFKKCIIAGGSMCTAIGLLQSPHPSIDVLMILPVWKGCTREWIDERLHHTGVKPVIRYEVVLNAHRGGFAKWDQALVAFMSDMTRRTHVPLDPVYTGKLMMWMSTEEAKKWIGEDPTLVIHTGGLQGLHGMAWQHPKDWHMYREQVKEIYPKQDWV